MKLLNLRVLLILVVTELSVCFLPIHQRALRPCRLKMGFWDNAQLAKIASDEKIEKARIALEEKKIALEEKKVAVEEKKIVHADMNQKASREVEEKKITLTYSCLLVFAVLFVFFGRGGGSNIDKILAVTKGFQSSLDKLVLIAQGFGVKSFLEYLHSPITWLIRKFGIL